MFQLDFDAIVIIKIFNLKRIYFVMIFFNKISDSLKEGCILR